MNCLHCTAETTNGLALCETCRAAASVYLEFFPVYFRNLARWRPGRSGVRDVPGSREPQGPPLAPSDRVSRALDEAGNALVAWSKALAEDRVLDLPESGDEVDQAFVLCRWLNEHLTSIATLDWCGEFMRTDHREGEEYDGIGYHEAKLRRLTEQIIPGWYAGACRQCSAETFVVPGLTWVSCGSCGATTYARDHLETILEEARGWTAPPKALAGAIVAMVDTEESIEDLRKRIAIWATRGQIATLRRHQYARKQHRLGDVLDRIQVLRLAG